VAGVGDELPHAPVGFGAVRERAIHIVQQSVQGVSDDSHLVVRIGVLRLHPGGDAMIVAGKWRAGDLGSGRGDAAQRAQCVSDHQRGEARRYQHCGDQKHYGTDDSVGDGSVCKVQ
jgi:hypothetical protein